MFALRGYPVKLDRSDPSAPDGARVDGMVARGQLEGRAERVDAVHRGVEHVGAVYAQYERPVGQGLEGVRSRTCSVQGTDRTKGPPGGSEGLGGFAQAEGRI